MNSSYQSELINKMQEVGIVPSNFNFISYGEKHRFHIEGDKKQSLNGEYQLFDENPIKGYFKSHKIENSYTPVCIKKESQPVTTKKEIEANRKKAEKEKKTIQSEATKKAYKLWDDSPKATKDNWYLNLKKIEPIGNVKEGNKGQLIIPLFDKNDNFSTIQTIFPNQKDKKIFYPDAPKTGSSLLLNGALNDLLILCEGYATGAKIHELTNQSVIVCFDAYNLEYIANDRKDFFTQNKTIVFADNDHLKETNKGIETAKKTGLNYIYPDFEEHQTGSDFQDYWVLHGTEKSIQMIADKLTENNKTPSKKSTQKNKSLSKPLSKTSFPDQKESGALKNTIENLKHLFKEYGIECKLNTMTKEVDLLIPNKVFDLSNKANNEISYCESLCALNDINPNKVKSYMDYIATENQYHPAKDWLLSNKWDGINRLSKFYNTIEVPVYFNSYLKIIIIQKWLTSFVASLLHKGFSARGVLVLQGEQNIGKTQWIKRLAPKHFVKEGAYIDMNNKDTILESIKYPIVELGELEQTLKTGSKTIGAFKAFISREYDELRKPYANAPIKYTRQTIFCGSVNQSDFLEDPTGNSRFWVLPCKKINYKYDIDMQQVFAEIYEEHYLKWNQKSNDTLPWFLTAEEDQLLYTENKQFEKVNPIEDILLSEFDFESTERNNKVSSSELLKANYFQNNNIKINCNSLGRSLTSLGITRNGSRKYLMPSLRHKS